VSLRDQRLRMEVGQTAQPQIFYVFFNRTHFVHIVSAVDSSPGWPDIMNGYIYTSENVDIVCMLLIDHPLSN
jgi:hypothetical protein